MANKKISELQSRTPALSDLILVGDPSSGYSYKCTVTALATIIETDIADGFVTIGTTQTISGAKTFSNNLTLTSVANTPTDPDKFLTLNASNVVTYRTGSQVLSDIGAADDTLVVHLAGTETITGYKTFSSFAGFDSAVSLKQNSTIVSQTGYSSISASANGFFLTRAAGIHAFLNLADLTTTRNFTFPDVTGTLALTTDITNALTSYVPNTRTLTINGVTQSLAANRTFNVGTVETVNFTTGTTGTDVNVSGSPITTSGTITLNIPTASATSRGVLLSSDWTTFNNKQNAITLTTSGSSGAATLVGSTLNIPQYQAVLSNPVTGTGTTNYVTKWTSSSAVGNSQIFDNGTNVGIGNASPAYKLDVNGSIYGTDIIGSTSVNVSSGNGLFLNNTGNTNYYTLYTNSSNVFNIGFGNTTPIVSINSSGNITANSFIKTGGTSSQYLMADGSTSTLTNPVTGTGTTNYIPKFTSSSAIGNSIMQESSSTISIAGTGATSINVRGASGNGSSIFFTEAGIADRYLIGTPASSGDLVFRSGAYDFSSGSERLRISSTGNVGIGTSSPSYPLTVGVGGSATGVLRAGTSFVSIDAGYQSAGVYGTAAAPSLIIGGDDNTGIWHPASDVLAISTAGSERMRLDASGNLGLGVTPSAWFASSKALQIGSSAAPYLSLFQQTTSTSDGYLGWGAYLTGNRTFAYTTTGDAVSLYRLNAGQHTWFTAPSGTAGNAISFTQAMTLDASGNLLVGRTSGTYKLDMKIAASGTNQNAVNISNDLDASFEVYLKTNTTTINAGGAGNLVFANGGGVTERMRLDASGNLGLGVSPSAWSTTYRALQINTTAAIAGGSDEALLGNNWYQNTSGNSIYLTTNFATLFRQYNGQHQWFTAPSGSSGAAISWTQAMTLASTGNLLVGGTSDAGYKLDVSGTGRFSSDVAISGSSGALYSLGQLGFTNTGVGGQYGIYTLGTGTPIMYFDHRATGNTGQWVWRSGTGGATTALTLSNAGAATFSSSVTASSGTFSQSSGITTIIQADWDRSATNNSQLYIRGNSNTNKQLRIGYDTNGDVGYIQALISGTGTSNLLINPSGGNVGIGTTDTSNGILNLNGVLDINKDSTTVGARWRRGATTVGYIGTGDWAVNGLGTSDFGISSGSSGVLVFGTQAGAERMRITSGGELLINTTSDAGDYKLQVNGNGYLASGSYSSGAILYLRDAVATGSNTSFAGLFLGSSPGTDYVIGKQSTNLVGTLAIKTGAGSTLLTLDASGNQELTGSIKTAAPSGGTAVPWKLGDKLSTSVTLDTGNYIPVEVNGVTYYLALVTLN